MTNSPGFGPLCGSSTKSGSPMCADASVSLTALFSRHAVNIREETEEVEEAEASDPTLSLEGLRPLAENFWPAVLNECNRRGLLSRVFLDTWLSSSLVLRTISRSRSAASKALIFSCAAANCPDIKAICLRISASFEHGRPISDIETDR